MRGKCEKCGNFIFTKEIFNAMERCPKCESVLDKSKLNISFYLLFISAIPVKIFIFDIFFAQSIARNIAITIYFVIAFLFFLLLRWYWGYKVKQ